MYEKSFCLHSWIKIESFELLTENENKKVEDSTLVWGKSLAHFPFFTIKEVERHRLNSGKQSGQAIMKTLDRGRKFKGERYLSSDDIFIADAP